MDWPNLTPGPIPPFIFYVSNKFAETAFNQSFQFYANFRVKLFVLLLHFASVIRKFFHISIFCFISFFEETFFFFQFFFLSLKFSIFFSFLTSFQFTFFSANNHIFYSTRQTSIEKKWLLTYHTLCKPIFQVLAYLARFWTEKKPKFWFFD